MAVFEWRPVSVSIGVPDDGPKCYKTYRRGAKTFWRNYHRDVPGGVSFVQRLAESLRAEYERSIAYLNTAIHTEAR